MVMYAFLGWDGLFILKENWKGLQFVVAVGRDFCHHPGN